MCVHFLRPLYAVSSWVITITRLCSSIPVWVWTLQRRIYVWFQARDDVSFCDSGLIHSVLNKDPGLVPPWFTYIRSHSCGKVHLRKRSFSFLETFSECLACDSKILDYMAGRVCVTINEGSETQRLHWDRTAYVRCIEDLVCHQSAEMRLG